jgi:hypothetical protein
MRITRDLLLKLARQTAAQRTKADRHILCIYLTGSLRREDPLLGGTADIDLVIVHDDQPAVEREIVRLSHEVHLDIAHLPESVFRQPRHLRLDPWWGAYLCDNPLVLHDNTQHWFEFTQAGVNAQFYRPDYVLERCAPLAESARQDWLGLEAAPLPLTPPILWNYLRVLEKAANAIACLSGVPLTERRFMLNFPQRTQAIRRPGLASGLTDLFTPQALNAEDWGAWIVSWKETLVEAAKQPTCPVRLQTPRHAYYTEAASALFPDFPAAAVWILLRTWTSALCCLPEDYPLRPRWQGALDTLGLDSEQFPARLTTLDSYLDTVEETLEWWGKQNGV